MPRLEVETGRSLAYEHYQGERRPVLLIHGWGAARRVWDSMLVALIDAGHTVVTFDQRCCGESDKDFATVSIAASAQDVVALADALELRDVVLNGWSLGGAIAVAAAELLGPRCAAVVSTCGATPRYTAAADFPHGGAEADVHATVAAIRLNRASVLWGVAEAVMAKPDAATTAWMAGMFLQMSPPGDRALLDLAALEQRATLARLSQPFLSVIGGRDVFVPPEIGRLAATLAPRGQAVEFAECGHAPFLEDPASYRAALLAFIAQLD